MSGRGFCKIKRSPYALLTNETKPPFTQCIKRVWVKTRDSTLNKNKNTARFIWGPIQASSISLTKHVRAYNTLLPLDENASQLLSCLLFTSGLRSWVEVIQVNKKVAGSLEDWLAWSQTHSLCWLFIIFLPLIYTEPLKAIKAPELWISRLRKPEGEAMWQYISKELVASTSPLKW